MAPRQNKALHSKSSNFTNALSNKSPASKSNKTSTEQDTHWDYKYSKQVLSNGLTLVEVAQPHLHSTSISVFIEVGSRFESQKDNGLSHFLEHMVFRGTKLFPTSFDLNLALEKLGGTLDASTSPDTTEFSINLPAQTSKQGIEILSQVVTQPRFDDIDIERRIVAEEIREDLDENDNIVDIDYWSRSRLWKNNPLGQTITGPIKNVMNFSLHDLKRWFVTKYVAQNMVLCISGATSAEQIETAKKFFGKIPCGKKIEDLSSPYLSKNSNPIHVVKPGSQTQLRISFHAPGLLDKDCITTEILMRTLDDGMSTPLHRRIFEDLGLAYNINASIEAYKDVGAVNIDATCSHENVAAIATEVLSIISNLKTKSIDFETINKAKSRAIWDLRDFQDSPAGMSSWYGEQELFSNVKTLEDEASKIESIEKAQLKKIANHIFTSSNLLVTTVGIQSTEQQQTLKKIIASFF